MPRLPRLDAPGTLHHVMARGITRQTIFRGDRDRDDFLGRVARMVDEKAWTVYAWALIPNHFHLLVRTGTLPLSRTMRRLMTGYAVSFNRRYRRWGHLFQNRFKSIVVEEEGYFLELVRYLHLNPLRAGQVKTLRELDGFPYSGHSVLMGRAKRGWQDTESVLGRYARRVGVARRRYREFVEAGVALGRRRDLQGGGLLRSVGGWEAVKALRKGREAFRSDERVLGSSGYVERLLREAEQTEARRARHPGRALTFETLLKRVAEGLRVSPRALTSSGRSRSLAQARAILTYVWTDELGRGGRELARRLGVSPQAVYLSAQRGRTQATRMKEDIERWCR